MKNGFKLFWKDYAELTEAEYKWYKKHWFGYIVLSMVMTTGTLVWLFRDSIKEKFVKVFRTKLDKCVNEEKEEES